ncbi:hypothetical protein DICVIV_10832 [Dictyocaulus viviparus]|uniref:Uncharacterized protein n=1 Tax=Dictyocaulus viviparus TaxID=29172 RepID=A0A0D8XEW4_DICVI|nr:hypothetical protein DICVIV_10832 [Dictyocaulus viviparus]
MKLFIIINTVQIKITSRLIIKNHCCGSYHRLITLPPSRSASPELVISEYVKFLPSPDSLSSAHLSPIQIDDYATAVEVRQPMVRTCRESFLT